MANNDDNQHIPLPLPPSDETKSHRKREGPAHLSSKKKKKKATTDSSKQLVTVEDYDSDYMPTEEGKSNFKRLWSEKDEITLLKALKEQNNRSDMTGLFNFVKTSLEANVSKNQMCDKIRKLKKWYKNNTVDVMHLDGHKAKVYKLCQQLWGGEAKRCATSEVVAIDDEDPMSRKNWSRSKNYFQANYPHLFSRMENLYPRGDLTDEGYFSIMRMLMKYTSQEELQAMEQKWVDHFIQEIQVMAPKRMLLMEEELGLIEKAREAHASNTN